MNSFKAVLFDFDGVLAETMNDLFLAWKNSFDDFGVTITKEDYFPLEGMKVLKIAELISKKYNLNASPETIVKKKEKYYLDNHQFKFYNGVHELIEMLIKNNKYIVIVSASSKEKLEKTVPRHFLDKFNSIITSEDYTLGKPNPEPYLNAISRLNLKSEDCIVVENAPLGIKSAKNAGCFCIAITSTLSKDFLKEANLIVDKFEDLIHILNYETRIKTFNSS